MREFFEKNKWFIFPPLFILLILTLILIILAHGPQTSAFLYEIK